MVVRIRLARFGRKHQPVYNIVVAQARSARGSKPLEVIGTYDPIPKAAPHAPPDARKIKDIQLDITRARYWLGVGAQPSEPAWRLLSMLGLLQPRFQNGQYTGKPKIIDERKALDKVYDEEVEGIVLREMTEADNVPQEAVKVEAGA